MTGETELANHTKAVLVTELLIIHCDLIGVPPPELAAKAALLEEDKAKAEYFRLVIDKPRRGWWFVLIHHLHIKYINRCECVCD